MSLKALLIFEGHLLIDHDECVEEEGAHVVRHHPHVEHLYSGALLGRVPVSKKKVLDPSLNPSATEIKQENIFNMIF
jgi:hypothetical protein